MIKFDVSKLRSVYVYIVKVTGDFVYVVSHRNGEEFSPIGSTSGKHRDHEITKVRIHRSVSSGFFKYNVMKEFSTPRLASLNYYGSDIVSIEIQMYNFRLKAFQDPLHWQSNFSKVVLLLQERLSKIDNVWIDGQEIFWVENDNNASFSLSVDGSLRLKEVSYIRIQKMGLNLFQLQNTKKEIEAINSGKDEAILDFNNKAHLPISEGKVFAYYPNINNPEQEQICVFSPVLRSKNFDSVVSPVRPKKNGEAKKEVDEVKKAYMINSSQNPCYPNIEFAMRAAKTIGHLYGYQETDFLNIPEIVVKTGEVNFYNIEESSRLNTPINMSAMTCLAWLFGFIYRESDLNKMRDLSKMFRFVINNGLVFQKDIIIPFREDAPSGEIPLRSISYANRSLINENKSFALGLF